MTPLRRISAFALFFCALALLSGAVWMFAYSAGLSQTRARAEADLALAADRLTSQLQRFRELAVLLSDHPSLVPLVLNEPGADAAKAGALLLEMGDKTGSLGVVLVQASGAVLASSGAEAIEPGAMPAFSRAMDGALGAAHYISGAGRRVYVFAAPVFSPQGPARGAVLTFVDIEAIEWGWPADPEPVFFTDVMGQVFVSNRSELALRIVGFDFPEHREEVFQGQSIWHFEGWPYFPARALHLTQDMPVVGFTGEILLDLAPARSIAWSQAGIAAALCLAFGALLFWATERRRTLAVANQRLEARVAARTTALEAANTSLRREISERKEAEALLKRAQQELVQAGKLSALGQMSAGISHELNQPLMAIRSFAENGTLLLERGKGEAAGENLQRISELARRMGRIIKNLRAFARQEKETISDVDLVAVVEAVLELSAPRAHGAGIEIGWVAPGAPVMVRGGEVRLQQVLMNLVSNGIDAMEAQGGGRLDLTISLPEGAGAPVVLRVADTGPGIADPTKIFDPFYSTKEVGASEGMGLGLSISYGLVQSFGGAIRGRNRPEGGAEFAVELAPACPGAKMEAAQ